MISFNEFTYRVIAERYLSKPLSAIGSVKRGGRYNQPQTFPFLYTALSRVKALLEVEALFDFGDGVLKDAPRDPEVILSLDCALTKVLDLTDSAIQAKLSAATAELTSAEPSRFTLNSRGLATPLQELGRACAVRGISAIKVPSAAERKGRCINIFPKCMSPDESVKVLDNNGRVVAKLP